MLLLRLLPFSRRVAFVYMIAVCLLFMVHFKIADDFTYKHVKHYSTFRCKYGCFKEYLSSNQRFNSHTRLDLLSRLFNNKNTHKYNDKSQSISKKQSDYSQNSDVFVEFSTGNDTSVGKSGRGIGYNDTRYGVPLYEAPKGEVPFKRYPQSVILGFTKCGTRAMIEFMSLHPNIRVARNEVHFYDKDENFARGYGWYKQQMPLSYSDQITVEKTPAYVLTQRARDGMSRITPLVKLIMLVRDPVIRLVSQYLLKYRFYDEDERPPISAMYVNSTTGSFDPEMRPVDIGNYQKHIKMWLELFPMRQMLIINSEDLTLNPLNVMKAMEKFLNIPALFSERNIYYNRTSGFKCPRGFELDAQPRCLGKTKGLTHPKLSTESKTMLYNYYKPYNERLFKLLGYRILWSERDWGKEFK